MKNKIVSMALCLLLAMPCVLYAEEVEIQLMEVISMQPLPGDNPLDGQPNQERIRLVPMISVPPLMGTICPLPN